MPVITRRTLLQAALTQKKRPNILWLSCEDSSPMLGCYGDPHAITPELDRFAQQSVRYTHAYSVAGVCAPSRSGIITGMYPTALGSMHMRSTAVLPPGMKILPELLREAGYYCTNNAKTDYNFEVPKNAWNQVSREAHWKNRPADQPFFAVFNQEVTHESRYPLRGAAHAKQTPHVKPEQRQDPAKLTTLPPYYPDTPETRRDWANVYECLTEMDSWFGGHLRALTEAGLDRDTIVFFWGDHGVGLPRAKRWLYESGTHVPLMVRGIGRAGSTDDRLVSLIDLAPTVLDLAGVEIPKPMQGQSFLPKRPRRAHIFGARDRMDERYDMVRMVRDARFRYIRNYEPEKPYYQFMNTPEQGPTMREIRRLQKEGKLPPPAAQFAGETKPSEELYDVTRDPHEIRNLAGDPSYRGVLTRMRRVHETWQEQTLDLGFLPEPQLSSAARESMTPQRVRALRAAALANPNQAAALAGETDAAIRWWAARRGKPEAGRVDDPDPSVRVARAKTLKDINVLADFLTHPDGWIRLAAAQAIDELGRTALPILPAIQASLRAEKNRYVLRVLNRSNNLLAGVTNQVD